MPYGSQQITDVIPQRACLPDGGIDGHSEGRINKGAVHDLNYPQEMWFLRCR